MQTAVVTGPKGEEIYTDKYGRIKVQFHWDREGKHDENTTCFIRVATPWAGQNWGGISIPRIGQEVVVAFLEGDPDQPLVVGSVYNAKQMPPYGLPGGKVVSGLKSKTHKGSGYNEMSMDDTAGKEKITVHGQYDMGTTVEHDDTQTVHHNRTKTIDNDETTHVKHDRTETVDHDEKITIGNNRTEKVGVNESIDVVNRTGNVGKNETITVTLMRHAHRGCERGRRHRRGERDHGRRDASHHGRARTNPPTSAPTRATPSAAIKPTKSAGTAPHRSARTIR